MFKWALVFFVIAFVAAIFGFAGISGGAAGIPKMIFFISFALFLVAIIGGLARVSRTRPHG